MTETLKEQLAGSADTNPLRQWRRREGLSMMDVTRLMRVGMSSVQHWEQGTYFPNEASMEKIAQLLGVKTETLTRNWKRWYNEGPTS